MATSKQQLYFYSPEGLALVKHDRAEASAFLRAAAQTLAQLDNGQPAVYATDKQGAVLRYASYPLQYTVYGFDIATQPASALRFAGQWKDISTGYYLLGEGYRAFIPKLMRFNAADSMSPFGKGGLNGYCYCTGDPVNRVDPTGHAGSLIVFAKRIARVPGNKHANVLAYQGRDTGKWIDELRARTKFSTKDLPVMEGAGASATRDGLKLYNDMVSNPPENKADVRYVAAEKLADAIDQIQFLQVRAKASMERDKVRAAWLEPPKKSG